MKENIIDFNLFRHFKKIENVAGFLFIEDIPEYSMPALQYPSSCKLKSNAPTIAGISIFIFNFPIEKMTISFYSHYKIVHFNFVYPWSCYFPHELPVLLCCQPITHGIWMGGGGSGWRIWYVLLQIKIPVCHLFFRICQCHTKLDGITQTTSAWLLVVLECRFKLMVSLLLL